MLQGPCLGKIEINHYRERKTAVVVELITKKIKSLENLEQFLQNFKTNDSVQLDGFEITTEVDPRVNLAKTLVLELFDLLSCNNTASIAIELEKKVMTDEWFTKRNFKPTVRLALISRLIFGRE